MKLPFYFKTMGMRQDFESCRFSFIIKVEVFFMKYPKFLNVNNNTIGVCAMSSGVGHKLDSYDESIEYIKSHGINVIETNSVRNDSEPSCDAFTRVTELNSLVNDSNVDAIWLAAGGDFQFETLPYLDFDLIEKNPKWYLGASDPTNLLFPITCKCDLATVYGFNAGSFDEFGINEYSDLCIEFLKGKNNVLHSSSLHQDVDFYNDGAPILNTNTEYVGSCDAEGRLLGGCFESINDMAGTPYDFVEEFNERYKLDGIIWFFDIFSMNSCDVYRALLKLKYMGYFKYTKAILVGRVLFKNVSDLIGYEQAFKKALPDIDVVFKMDIGHTYPHMYVVNGAMAKVKVNDGCGSIHYEIKE